MDFMFEKQLQTVVGASTLIEGTVHVYAECN